MVRKKIKFNPQKYIKENYIEDDKINISININDKHDFYDELDVKKLTLSRNVADYIDFKLRNVIYKKNVTLTFHTLELSDEEQEDIIKLIRSYYGLILFQQKRELNFNKMRILMLFLIGLVFLASTYILSSTYVLIKDILSIAGWVSIWEMFSIILFDIIRAQREKHNYLRLYNAKIRFEMKKS
jgi:hypothetical protein